MKFKSVLIESEDESKNVIGFSGTMINAEFVITASHELQNSIPKRNYNYLGKNKAARLIEFTGRHSNKLNVIWKKSSTVYNIVPASILCVVSCENIRHSSRSIFSHWAFHTIENNKNLNDALSFFFILKIRRESTVSELERVLSEWHRNISRIKLKKGDGLLCIGAPFGNRFFLDTHCKGIVSNVIGDSGCMILSDCPTAPGMEGSPIFHMQSNVPYPVGITILSVSWWKGEWVGMTMMADFRSVIAELINCNVLCIENGQTLKDSNSNHCIRFAANNSIVQIYSRNAWGTAILVSKEHGIFITNAHVIDNNEDIKLYWRNQTANAKLVFKTSKKSAFDLSVVKCGNEDFLKKLSARELTHAKVSSGDPVYCISYPLLPRTVKGSAPSTVTRGHATLDGQYMLRATCSAHPGSSGGAVLDSSGQLLGVVVSNAKLENGAVYPRIVAALPVKAFAQPLITYLATRDSSVLEILNESNMEAIVVWKRLAGKL